MGVTAARPGPPTTIAATEERGDRFVAGALLTVAGGVRWVDDRDPFHCTPVIDGSDVHAILAATCRVRIPVDLAPGSSRTWCDVPGHESMVGAPHVR